MKRLLLFCFFLIVVILPGYILAQADDCNTPATTITLSTSTCTSLSGNTSSATASSGVPACVGTADDDVWYRFTTPANAANYAFVYVDPASSGFDPVFQVLSGACGSQSSIACVNAGGAGVSESVSFTGVTASTTYYFRVYGYASGSGGDGSFTVCAFNGAKPSNDECAGAVNLAQGATCSGTAGTSAWATTSSGVPACVGTADDDVWYRFTTGDGVTYEHIKVVPDADMDAVVQVFSGACGSLTSISCQNSVGAGGAEDFFVSGLTGSTQYYVRVYHYGSYYGNITNSGTFSICVQGGSPPANDDCAAAVNLPANGSCVTTNGTTTFATPSGTGSACTGGSVDDDVWYSFSAVDLSHTITVTPASSGMNPQIQVLSGTCPGGLLSHQCADASGNNIAETMVVTNLTIGNTYFVRVSHNGTYYGSGGDFTICNIGGVTEPGNEPCAAKPLPTITTACIYGTYNIFASASQSGCSGCAAACASGTTKDVWFSFVAPSNGKVDITVWPGTLTDPTMTLFSSTGCSGTFTNIGCNDDGGPGLAPYYYKTGLTAGATYYIRIASASGSETGNFKLCVSTPSNDECTSPVFVCDLNGYRGTTSYSYTESAWENGMEYNNPFGDGSTTTENPSWMQFEASATTASFTVTIADCWVGNGIQMEVLSGTCGGAMVSKSSFLESSTSQTVNVTGLTVGQTYYIMIDGYAGDVCNFQINGSSGIATSVLTSSPIVSICSGSTTNITVDPVGSGASISWSSTPTGFSGSNSSITANPVTDPNPDLDPASGTVTYTATITGNCITTQTVSANVTVNATPPAPAVTATPTALCGVTSLTLSASAANANDYEWFDVSSGGTVLHNGANYTPSVNDNQISTYTWYASAYNNTGNPACTSSTRGSVSVPVNSWEGKIKWEGDVNGNDI